MFFTWSNNLSWQYVDLPVKIYSGTLSQNLIKQHTHKQTHSMTRFDTCNRWSWCVLDIRPAERNAPQLQLPFLPPPLLPPLQSWILCSSQLLPVRTGTLQNRTNPALYWPLMSKWLMHDEKKCHDGYKIRGTIICRLYIYFKTSGCVTQSDPHGSELVSPLRLGSAKPL